MKLLIGSYLIVLACAAGVYGEEAEKPDFASLDKPVLLILVENQYHEIERLRAEVEALKVKIAAVHGGAEAVVIGDVTSIDEGAWRVTIESVTATNVTPMQEQIVELRKRLEGQVIYGGYNQPGQQTGLEARLRAAEQDLQSLTSRGKYRHKVTNSGHTIHNDSNLGGYTDKQLNDAKAAVRRLKGEKQGIDRKILSLERRIEHERDNVTAQGVTDDGVPVTIKATGVYANVGQSLEAGKTYALTGRGQFNANSGKITVKTAVEVRDAAAEALGAE